MNEEQLLQEARIEAEKVYPTLEIDLKTPKDEIRSALIRQRDNSLLNMGYTEGYIANAKKQMSEAVEFGQFVFDYTQYRRNVDIIELYRLSRKQKQE